MRIRSFATYKAPIRTLLGWLVACVVTTPLPPAMAGECVYPESYVECLEHYSPGQQWVQHEQGYCFFCLKYNGDFFSHRWAGPIAADYFKSRREDRYRDRIGMACVRIISDRAQCGSVTDEFGYAAAGVLAHYGIASANEYDVYSILIQRPDKIDLIDLAALGDPRSVQWLSARYDSLRAIGLEKPFNRTAIQDVLNCLYHIPGQEAVDLARTIEAKETDANLRSRAHRVLSRPSSVGTR